MFGQETQARQERINRFSEFVRSRTPWSLAATLFGVLSVLDAFTIVIGLLTGIGAIVTSVVGLRDIQARPHLGGARLCKTAMVLGSLGIALSIVMATVVYPMIEQSS